MTAVQLTDEGRKRLEVELNGQRERLAEVEEAIRQMLLCKCDLEQLTLAEARERKARLEGEVNRLEEILAGATGLAGDRSGDAVELGAYVELRDQASGEETMVRVVSAPEAAVAGDGAVTISDTSPVGSRLMGRSVGDVISVPASRERVSYEVRRIKY